MELRWNLDQRKKPIDYSKGNNTQLIIVVDSQLKIEGIGHTVHILINITENHPLHTMSIGVETHVYLSMLTIMLDATMNSCRFEYSSIHLIDLLVLFGSHHLIESHQVSILDINKELVETLDYNQFLMMCISVFCKCHI